MVDDPLYVPAENYIKKSLLDRFDTRSFIAIVLTLSMITLTFVLALRAPESDSFKILLGAMLTVGFGSAIGWYFNSSAGSDAKDRQQAKVAEKLAEKVVVPPVVDAIQAAAMVAPAAAAVAAPPAAEVAAPPAAREAVEDALSDRGIEPTQPQEPTDRKD